MSIEAAATGLHTWPEGLTRVPYWAFQNEDVYRAEQQQIFQGNSWNYLCLEAEVAKAGDFRTSFVGDAPVIVARDTDGEIYAFENRCAHRGALICLDSYGANKKDFNCVYHAWTYDLKGNLIGVAFKDGVKGKGGMPPSFRMEDHSPRKLRIALVHGLVFGSFSEEVPPIEEYIGDTIMARIERVLAGRKPAVIGRYTQVLPNNWKLYMENVKDSYHASILHLFFTTFEINRLSQTGAIIVDESGGNTSAIRRSIARPGAIRSTRTSNFAPTASTGLPIHHCSRALTNSPTASRCRFFQCSQLSSCSRSRTPSRYGRSCRVGSAAPI